MMVVCGNKNEIYVAWGAPPDGWSAMNVDGSSKGSLSLAGGRVGRSYGTIGVL